MHLPRTLRRRKAFALALIPLALAACGGNGGAGGGVAGGTAAAGSQQPGGDLVIARAADSRSMDKTAIFDNESIWVFQQLYEGLFEVGDDGKTVKPLLATGYELGEDQKTYTIKLREGVKFHNGREMTSADVKFSIDEATRTKGGWEFINAAFGRITTPDKYTVVLKTKYRWAPTVADLALFNNGIIPKDYAGKSKEQFYKAPIGTGPFKWDSWRRGQELRMVKNPDYWDTGKPFLDSVTWKVVQDDNSRVMQLKGGEVDVAAHVGFAQVSALKSTPSVQMGLYPSTRIDYLIFNHKTKPLDDVHVRRAISYALDRNALKDAVLFKNGDPGVSFLTPNVPFFDPETPILDNDLEKAKQELAQSSVPKGFSVEFTVGSGDTLETSIAEIIQQRLAPLGIEVKIRKIDASNVLAQQQELNYEMGHTFWTMDIADPDELVSYAVDPDGGGANSLYTTWKDDEVIALNKKAQREFDEAERQRLYSEVQAKVAEESPYIPLFYPPFAYATSDKVSGFKVYPTANYHLEDVSLAG